MFALNQNCKRSNTASMQPDCKKRNLAKTSALSFFFFFFFFFCLRKFFFFFFFFIIIFFIEKNKILQY